MAYSDPNRGYDLLKRCEDLIDSHWSGNLPLGGLSAHVSLYQEAVYQIIYEALGSDSGPEPVFLVTPQNLPRLKSKYGNSFMMSDQLNFDPPENRFNYARKLMGLAYDLYRVSSTNDKGPVLLSEHSIILWAIRENLISRREDLLIELEPYQQSPGIVTLLDWINNEIRSYAYRLASVALRWLSGTPQYPRLDQIPELGGSGPAEIGGEEATCAVCFLGLTDEDSMVTPCQHTFHRACIILAATQTNQNYGKCPVCRQLLPSQYAQLQP